MVDFYSNGAFRLFHIRCMSMWLMEQITNTNLHKCILDCVAMAARASGQWWESVRQRSSMLAYQSQSLTIVISRAASLSSNWQWNGDRIPAIYMLSFYITSPHFNCHLTNLCRCIVGLNSVIHLSLEINQSHYSNLPKVNAHVMTQWRIWSIISLPPPPLSTP